MTKPIQLNDALKGFGEFVRTVKISSDALPWDPNAFEYFFSRADLSVSLTGTDARSYQRCLRDLYGALATKQILSRGAVDNLANTAFAHIVRKSMTVPMHSLDFQSFCDHELKELRKALERKPDTWNVLSRACGIDQAGLPMNVGKVSFVLATPAMLDSIPESEISKGVTRERFAGNVLGRLSVPAVDSDAAKANATRILQQTMDCLNFFAAVSGVPGQAYVLGEKEAGFGLSISLGPDNQVVHQSFLYGPLQPFAFGKCTWPSSAV